MLKREITHAGFFEGMGGFSYAGELKGWKTKIWCECNPFCQTILRHYFPEAQEYDFIQKHNYEKHANTIDVFTAGFPCQPYSLAGNRAGEDDDRFLWPETIRAVKEIKPRIAIFENVAGLLSILEPASLSTVENKALHLFGEGNTDYEVIRSIESIERRIIGRIIEDIEAAGYSLPKLSDGTPIVLCIPAAGVNAPHRRDRIWLVAYRKGYGSNCTTPTGNGQTEATQREQLQQHIVQPGGKQSTANTNGERSKTGKRCQQPTDHKKNSAGPHNSTERLSSDEIIADTNSDGYQQRRPGENRSAAGESKGEGLQWERIWGHIERISKQGPVANTTGSGGLQIDRAGKSGQPDEINTGITSWQNDTDTSSAKSKGRTDKAKSNGQQSAGGTEPSRLYISTDWTDFPTQSPICFGNDGLPSGLDGITVSKWRNESIKAAGNAIVPRVALAIYDAVEILEQYISENT